MKTTTRTNQHNVAKHTTTVPKTLPATLLKTIDDDGKKGECDPLGAKGCLSASSVQFFVWDHGATSKLMSHVAALQTVIDSLVTKLQEHFMNHNVVAVNILNITTPSPSEKPRKALADASWHTDVCDPKVITKPMPQLLGTLGAPCIWPPPNGRDEWRWHDPCGRLHRFLLHAPGVGHDFCDQGEQHQRRAQSSAPLV